VFFRGKGHGFQGEAVGEVVFNTSMTGYQEILTDPSYAGQIVTMTYPMIGNTGINREDIESRKPFLEAFIIRRMSPIASNWRTTESLDAYLIANRIPVISDIDTRALVRHIRLKGSMRGIVSLVDHDEASLMRKVKSAPQMVGWDLASKVSIEKSYSGSKEPLTFVEFSPLAGTQPSDRHVVAYDFGIKTNILRDLVHCGGRVTVVPSKTPAEEVLNLKPDGIFLSNGPGDPEAVDYAIRNVRHLLGKKPIFGICLGHQIMGLAFGGRTFKLKFGHHGGNQPVSIPISIRWRLRPKITVSLSIQGACRRRFASHTSTSTTRLSKAWSINPCRLTACNTTRRLHRVRTTLTTSLRSFSK
jgi:carbamoyl-phosphate synthase small subunit